MKWLADGEDIADVAEAAAGSDDLNVFAGETVQAPVAD
jgi:hypothetical protein